MYGLLIFAAGAVLGFVPCLIMAYRLKRMRREAQAVKRGFSTGVNYDAKMLNLFSDALPIHVYIKNADDNFNYLYSNRTRNEFFGMTAGKIVGHNDMVLLAPEAAAAQLAVDAGIMKKPHGIYEGFIETHDRQGAKKYFRIAQTQFTDKSGVHLLLGAALDVTELEESRRMLDDAKKRIEERELWLSRTLRSIGDAVIVTDKQGNTVLLNPVAERMLGVKSDAAAGKPHEEIFRIVGALDNEPRPSPVSRALRTGVIVELASHTDLISATGERYHISDSAAPILDEQRNILGAVLVFRDVTEEFQRRTALRDSLNDWEMASSIGGIVSFRIDYRTRKISGSRNLPEFWPVVDGMAVAPEEWVLPEDIGGGQDLMAAVSAGKETHTYYKYRARKNGKIRHYRIYGAVDPERPGEINGIIQDMTDAYESERQLQNTREMWNSLIDALPLNFFAKNADDSFRYTHCNKKFADFVGKTPAEIVGKTDAELFGHPGDSEHFEAADRAIIESGRACNFTEEAFGAKKRPTHYQTVKMPCTGPEGERLLLGVSIDITELAALSKNQEVIRQGLETLVAETDVNEGIEKAMKSVCEYMGVARSYILHFDLGKKTVSCVREYCRQGERNLLDELQDVPYSTGVDWEEHFRNECFFNFPDLQNDETVKLLGPFYSKLVKDGDFHSLYCHRLIIDGKFWGYVGLAYEKEVRVLEQNELDFVQSASRFIELMIRHKRTQEELREAVVQANAAEKAKSNFLAAMSHEIRTPLNAVIGYSELLKDGTLPELEQKDYLNDISIAGNALLALINDILDLSKLEAGKMQFAHSETDFAGLVHEIMVVFRQKLKEKHLEERVEINDVPPVKVDPLRIRQILFNLVGNAVKFTDSGSITVSAGFTPDAGKNTGTLRFAVRDTGCGISEDDRKSLFQPFVQSKAMLGTRVAACGSGLGLVLVRRMLEFMNGGITLESTPGEGSVFSIVIRDVEYTAEPFSAQGTPSQEQSIQPAAPCGILLVDDVPMNLKVMTAMLKKLGMDTVSAGNAFEALEMLEKRKFDILLTDLWMPGMNGAELADKIRSSGKYPEMKMAVVTADSDAGANFNSRTFDAVLTKPVTLEKLNRIIVNFRR